MAIFHDVFKDIEPPQKAPKSTLEQTLAVYRKAILMERRRGLSWKQIAVRMRDPRINQKVTAKTLARLFGEKKPKEAKPEKPTVPHLIIDPLTGLPIPPGGA